MGDGTNPSPPSGGEGWERGAPDSASSINISLTTPSDCVDILW